MSAEAEARMILLPLIFETPGTCFDKSAKGTNIRRQN